MGESGVQDEGQGLTGCGIKHEERGTGKGQKGDRGSGALSGIRKGILMEEGEGWEPVRGAEGWRGKRY